MDFSREEKEHNWLGAAKSYEQTLLSTTHDVSFAAECWERIGFCYNFASRQAADVEEFRKLGEQAIAAYETAAGLFKGNLMPQGQGKHARCLALAEYMRSWLASDCAEKEKILSACWVHGKKALAAFQRFGDALNFGKTCNILSLCLFDRLYLAPTIEEKRRISREGMSISGEGISVLSKLNDRDELAIAFAASSLQSWYLANISEQEVEQRDLTTRSLNYAREATALSRETGNSYSCAMSLWAASLSDLYFTENIETSSELAREMLHHAEASRDNYFQGIAFYLLAHITDWTVDLEANQDKKKQKYLEIIEYSKNSINRLQLVCQNLDTAEAYRFYTETCLYLAREFMFTLNEKLAYSKRAVEIGEKGLDFAAKSGCPEPIGSSLHALSKAFHYRSDLESRKDKKRELLKKALICRNDFITTVEKAFPANWWTLGVGLVYSGKIKAGLAEQERGNRTALLREAIVDMEKGVAHCNNWIKSRNVPSLTSIVAGFEDSFGALLNEYYQLTKDKDALVKAKRVYGEAAEKFKRVDLPSRVAESYWKIARNLDQIGDYLEAAENFENAFAGYKAAAEKISEFSEFYLDYASYMKAWSEIQHAKLANFNEEYAGARQHYENTSNILAKSKRWGYLSSNFHAWAHLEFAEDLSRQENCREAKVSFEQAIKLFQESERALRTRLNKIDKMDERELVIRLVDASGEREDYGRGRIEIEEAKILDKKGDHAASSEKYAAAASTFERLAQADSEQIRKEVKPLVCLCQAWQKMTLAEARSSPALYREAAELFKHANQLAHNEPMSLLALAHSSFCRALESGTEFENTRDEAMYLETKRHMDAAASYYLKAGFETASDYAKATQRLFDAYVFMDNAKKVSDPEKEAKFYLMAEKVLQTSAEAYTRANHAEKTGQVMRLLMKVREEKELALSLSEVLHAPAIASSTASFGTLSPNEEKAVGLERFEHANIHAKLIRCGEGAKVGEEVSLAIQVVNVGKEPVFLTRVENVLPSGFQFSGNPAGYSLEGNHLLMKGNRLDPLKTETIPLLFKPFRRVDAELKPRIICVDETGRQMLYELEPQILQVSQVPLAGRVSTGTESLDGLLLGGIPEGYSVLLSSPSCDERDLLVRNFLEAGIRKNQETFCITAEPGTAKALAEQNPSVFHLFICNPRADLLVADLPNISKLKGIENLTDIDITLLKSFRALSTNSVGPRRVCLEIVSDVLLQHHALLTRRWIAGLLPELCSKGFTTLAVMNPQMHPPEEVEAILGLFEGEIRISEEAESVGHERRLSIRKLRSQRYLETEIVLEKNELSGEGSG